MANWKYGVSFDGDGNMQPEANHIFVSAIFGSDVSGNGSPSNPYASVQHAENQTASINTLVVGTGAYNIVNWTPKHGTIRIQGDGYVLFYGGIGQTFFPYGNIHGRLTNLVFKDYDDLWINYYHSTDWNKVTLINCRNSAGSTGSDINDLICINSYFENRDDRPVTLNRGVFVNSTLRSTRDETGKNYFTANNVFFDSTSIVEAPNASSLTLNHCNYLNSPIGNVVVNNSIAQEPLFNNSLGGDFSLQPNSPMVGTGSGGTNIGGVSIGDSHYVDTNQTEDNWWETILNSNGSIDFDSLGQLEVSVQTEIETSEFVESDLRFAPILSISGFPLVHIDPVISIPGSSHLIYEADFAQLDGIYTGEWKKLRFGEIPSWNEETGLYNGDDNFDWSKAVKIPHLKRKYRFTFLPKLMNNG